MSVSCWPVPALQASTNFLIIQPTLVLPCVSSVGLSQFYMHQLVEAIPIYVEELLLQLTCWVECTT